MKDGVKIIIASSQRELVASLRDGLRGAPLIESIETVSRPTDAEPRFSRSGVTVLIWDLDEFQPNHAWSKSVQNKHTLYTLYTSLSGGKYRMLPHSGNDVFLQKPAVFTPVTSWRFVSSVTELLDTMVKRQRPPNMRELVKMVDAGGKQKVVAIGSSTGGTNALEELLKKLPPDMPPIVVVQHMPSGFTKLFAERLNALYTQEVREAQSGDFLMRGRMLIAPADRHMRVVRQQGKLAVECYVGNRIHGVMPAADILFESCANVLGSSAVGVVLTGMGNDGAKGLKLMKNVGSKNIGQDEASCVVYGMPKAAKDIGAITQEFPLDKIADAIMQYAGQ